MYLKAVEIHGFKSFGEKVHIDFNRGITAIIGPNGSGKSNILDAVLWVLGEQSYKNIRAKESSDVIFSGGKNIKPMNYAEVSLIMDNADRYFPLDDDEIKVTRKLTAKGASSDTEYFINDKKARLKDISGMFLDTGIGKSAYSVIGQGRVERIIGSSPVEIKAIIEEAAGIKKFQINKAEAMKNLNSMVTELEKIDLIIKEVKENKDKVEKQAEKAIKFVEIRDERDKLAKAVYMADYNDKKSKWANNDVQKEKITKKITDLNESMSQVKDRLTKIDEEKTRIENEMEKINEKNKDLTDTISEKKTEKGKNEERIKSSNDSIAEKEERIKNTDKKSEEKESSLQNSIDGKKILELTVKNLEQETEEMQADVEKARKERDAKQVNYDSKNSKVTSMEMEKLKHQSEIENQTRRIKDSKSKITGLTNELKKWEKNTLELDSNIEKEKIALDEKEKIMHEKKERGEFLIKESSETSKKHSEIGRKIEEDQSEYNISNNKLQYLLKADESNEGYNKGVKEILNSGIQGIDGTFVSLVTIPEQYEKAIMAGSGGNMQDIVVPTSDVAKKCIALLKEKKVGKASFLALDTIKVNPKKISNISVDGVIGLASTLVASDTKYSKIVDFVLGNMLVVRDMDVGLKVIKSNLFFGSVVTLSGELLSARGRITGGESSKLTGGNLILERKREIALLDQKVKELALTLKANRALQEKYGKEVEFYENELDQIDFVIKEVTDNFDAGQKAYNDLLEQKKRLEREGEVIKADLENEKKYSEEYEKRIGSSQTEWEKLEDIISGIRADMEEEAKILNKMSKELSEQDKLFGDKRITYENNKNKVEQMSRDIENIKKDISDLATEKKDLLDQIEMTKGFIKGYEKTIEDLNVEINDLTNKYESENKDALQMKEQMKVLSEESTGLNTKRLDVQEELIRKEEESNKISETVERIKGEMAVLEENLKPLEEVEPIEIDINNLKEEKENFKKLDIKVKGFGDVNTLAINEFNELKERYSTLSDQKDDLVKGKDQLMELISEIDGNIRERFFKAHSEINANFNIMCADTLNNSEGKLELIDPDNFDQCGVEIYVKFKNKKRQSLSLLSGGEKSMVAIAFVISIFMYKPSPFTFLDEIEAALDEMNTAKLLAKLKEFTEKSQFILITHNKTTMSRSDSILGVSMNKDIGVTKILGVNVLSLDEFLKKNKGSDRAKPLKVAQKR